MTNSRNNSPSIFGNNDNQVFAIIVYCLSLAFSVLITSLETVRLTRAGFSFEFTWRTLFVFLISAAFVLPCFRIIFLSKRQTLRKAALAVVCAIGGGSFLYPLRFVPSEKFADIFLGLTIAACALTVVGGMLYIINRFLNMDAAASEANSGSEVR